MSDSEVASPCVSLCLLDREGVCAGCFRSAGEIAGWTLASAREKREILQRAQERRRESAPD
jgi:predicted Fe-S protein YdhL (DUF1289 family)